MIDLDFTAKFIAGFEGFVGTVYLDAVGVETIGYGETRRDIIERYRQSGISKQDAMALLKQRVQEFADAVEGRITNSAALTPNRHAALTSLAYNIGAGLGGFADSTACKRFNAGDLAGVPEAMGWWNKGDRGVLEGLTRRRAAEGALFVQDGPATLPGGQGSGSGGGGGGGGGSGGGVKLLRLGDRGDDVRAAQNRLAVCGSVLKLDGYYGPKTVDVVVNFQRQCGLDADGILGPATWKSLSTAAPAPPPNAPGCPPWPGRLLSQGEGGDDVRQAQRRLKERGWGIADDGVFGPKTEAIVRKYQTEKALAVDGIVGPLTWQALWVAPIT